jgi:transposase-like protein
MQDQVNVLEELIRTFVNDNMEGKRRLVEWFLNNVMDLEAKDQVLAARYGRSGNQKAHMNGYRKRTIKTSEGDLVLSKPQIRVSRSRQGFSRDIQGLRGQ